MKTRLEVSLPSEGSRYHPIEERTIVGSGSSADIALDVPGVTPQHFRIKLMPKYLDIRLAPGAGPLTYEGKPFSGGKVAYDTDFYLNQVRFNCATPKTASGSRVVPLLGAVVVVLGVLGYMFLQQVTESASLPPEQEVDVFAAGQPCPQSDAAGAARLAGRLEQAAVAKRERYRYDPHDGVEAGRLFAQASDCYAKASDAAGKQRMDQTGQVWRQKVTEEFRAARLRLHTALQNEQFNVALSEVQVLRRILRNEPNPYAEWLIQKERELKLLVPDT
jgi:hypothetical protein